jgi:hypothetical protein
VIGLHRRQRAAPAGARAGTVDPARVLRRRRSPLVLALGGMLVALVVVVEVLILQAYANVNRTTAIFGQQSYVTGALVNVQREALLLNVKIEELPATRDVRGAKVRRALLANQLTQLRSLGGGDPLVDATVEGVDQDLALIDRALARARRRRPRPALAPRPSGCARPSARPPSASSSCTTPRSRVSSAS